MNKTQQETERDIKPFYKNLWFRIIALILAASIFFSLWAVSAIQIRIEAENERDAAAQYLIDNTEYIQQNDVERLRELFASYRKATELADYYQTAGTQIAAGEYEQALGSIDKCLELYPGDNEALYLDLMLKRGCLYVLLGQYEQAVEALETVLMEKPDQADAYLVLAQIYSETGNYTGLIPVLEEYLKLKPDDGDIRLVLAQILFESGEYEKAVSHYDYLINDAAAEEASPEIRFLKALALIQLEKYGEALISLEQLDSDAVLMDGLDYYTGVCLLSNEEYAEAEDCFTKSIEKSQMLQLSHYSRGICRLMEECFDYDAALQDLHTVIEYQEADKDEILMLQAQTLLETIGVERLVIDDET